MLGFYVTIVVDRWWRIYMTIDFPDIQNLHISVYIPGNDEKTRIIRRTIARYLNLTLIFVLREISPSARKRFPTIKHLVDAGIMTEKEVEMLDGVISVHSKFWVPIQWCCGIVSKCREDGLIKSDYLLNKCMDELMKTRSLVGTLFGYDWVPVPLVYTQVVSLAVRSYFVICLFGRQFLDPTQKILGNELDLYLPPFTILQFCFFFGWLKVAEVLLNPLGEDDDDFEINYIIDRNTQIGYTIADVNYGIYPEPVRDKHMGEPDAILPYTKTLEDKIADPVKGSCADMTVSENDSNFIYPEVRSTALSRHSSAMSRNSSNKIYSSLRAKVFGSQKQIRNNKNEDSPTVSNQNVNIEMKVNPEAEQNNHLSTISEDDDEEIII